MKDCLWRFTVRALAFTIPLLLMLGGVRTLSAQEIGRRIEVEVGDNYYKPEVIRVKAGDLIVFTNKGKQLHSMTLIDHEDLLDEAYIDPGQTFTFAVPNSLPPGEYPLGCNVHMDMKGKIVVQR